MSLPQKYLREYDPIVSPAKINLRLKVTGRRADGYHLLSMTNATVGLRDQLRITLRAEPGVSIDADWRLQHDRPRDFSDPERNLAARAFTLFAEEFNLRCGCSIGIEKNIPLGGGLGGGSGNAAAVLNFLLGILAKELPADAVQQVTRKAAILGADIPYQMSGGVALVGGIGESICAVPSPEIEGEPLMLVFPEFGISTVSVFERMRAIQEFSSDESADALRRASELGKKISRAEMLSLIDNDLFPIACALEPALESLHKQLAQNTDWIVSMSGSGSTLFVFSRSPDGGNALERGVRSAVAGAGAQCFATAIARTQR